MSHKEPIMSCPSQKGATANKIRHKQECMWIATCTCFKVFAPHLPARKYCKYFFGQQSVTKLAMQQTEEEKNLQTSASLATLHELQNNTLGPCFICSCISIRDVLTCLFIMQAVVRKTKFSIYKYNRLYLQAHLCCFGPPENELSMSRHK